MRRALVSGLFSLSLLLSSTAVFAKSQLDSATLKKLTMLEQKFFGHTYDSETDEDRTKRIENIIYGTANTGSAADRINKLASVTYLDTRPDPTSAPSASTPTSTPLPSPIASNSSTPTGSTTSSSPPSSSSSKQTSPVPQPAPTRIEAKASPEPTPIARSKASAPKVAEQNYDDSDIPPSKPGADDYPHVTSLEKEILGSTFVGQPLSGRIVRMETKAFGAPSKSSDLGERTDNLEQYAQSKLHKKPFLADEQPDTVYDTASAGTGSSSGSAGDDKPHTLQSAYPHVTALENAILGQSNESQPLAKRLGNMEVKAFGKESSSDDLGGRTDALERYAEKTLHKKPFGQDVDYETAEGSGPGSAPKSKGDKLLSMVENTLLNFAGAGGGLMPGVGGLGPGAFGGSSGFAGVRMRRKQAPTEEPSAADEPTGPVEDPAIRAKEPPPPGTRLATRVGWCEMHVFGHTSANQHLAERLTALNRELNFEPGKSSIELMDHIDALVKAAQAFKAPIAGTSAKGATQ